MSHYRPALYEVFLEVRAREIAAPFAIVHKQVARVRVIALDEETAERAARTFADQQHFRLTRYPRWPDTVKVEIGAGVYVTPQSEAPVIDGIFEPALKGTNPQ